MPKIDKSVIVHDDGNFIHFAIELSKYFSSVKYYCPHTTAFPRSNSAWVGKGIEGVEWVDEFWKEVDTTDIFVFPDCRYSDVQVHLKKMGKQVFGSMYGTELENNRYFANEVLKEVGLPSVAMKRIKGISKLREYLKDHDDLYIKTNFRGDGETWHHTNYKMSEPQLDEIEHTLGILKKDYEFLVCEPIDGSDIIEIGVDTYIVNGEYPDTLLYGYEVKDLGYCGVVKKKENVSKIITEPLDKLMPVMKEYQYQGCFSDEIRVGNDKKPFLTDFTCRCGSPPSELYISMISNLPEVVDQVSKGLMVQPKYKAKYGVQAIIESEWAEKNWLPITFPDAIADYVKVKNLAIVDGMRYYIPINDVEMCQVGSVIAYDDTLEGAIKKLKEYSEQVDGYKLHICVGSMEKANEIISQGKKIGIYF